MAVFKYLNELDPILLTGAFYFFYVAMIYYRLTAYNCGWDQHF